MLSDRLTRGTADKPSLGSHHRNIGGTNHNHTRAATPENRSSGFPTRSDTNRHVQSQKQARSLKFRI